jgi:hypothetical protein
VETVAEIAALLEQAGAVPPRYGRGNWRCPEHPESRSPSLSVNLDKGVFRCFHVETGRECGFRGGVAFLKRRLNIRGGPWLSREQYLLQKRERERAERTQDASWRLSCAVRLRRIALLDWLRDLNWLESAAHDAGPDDPQTWPDLALVYCLRPTVEADLDFLESASAEETAYFLCRIDN